MRDRVDDGREAIEGNRRIREQLKERRELVDRVENHHRRLVLFEEEIERFKLG